MDKRAQRRVQRAADEDLRQVLMTPAGKRVVWRIVTAVCGAFSDDFDLDARLHARNAGKRAVGLALVKEAQRVAPREYLEMARERINKELVELEAVAAKAAEKAAAQARAEADEAAGDQGSAAGDSIAEP